MHYWCIGWIPYSWDAGLFILSRSIALQYVTTANQRSVFYLPLLLLTLVASSAWLMRRTRCGYTTVNRFVTSFLRLVMKWLLMCWMLFLMVTWKMATGPRPTSNVHLGMLSPAVLEKSQSSFFAFNKFSGRLLGRFLRTNWICLLVWTVIPLLCHPWQLFRAWSVWLRYKIFFMNGLVVSRNVYDRVRSNWSGIWTALKPKRASSKCSSLLALPVIFVRKWRRSRSNPLRLKRF